MCLVTTMKPVRTSTEIVAYKVLVLREEKEGWVTPFRKQKVAFGKTYRLKHLGKPDTWPGNCTVYEYEGGMYHTCANLDAAEQLVDSLLQDIRIRGVAICEAIIPKGTMYVAGLAMNLPTYGSDKIKYTRTLKAYAR